MEHNPAVTRREQIARENPPLIRTEPVPMQSAPRLQVHTHPDRLDEKDVYEYAREHPNNDSEPDSHE